jgi:hypothetical protein
MKKKATSMWVSWLLRQALREASLMRWARAKQIYVAIWITAKIWQIR